MFVASYRNTEASARFKQAVADDGIRRFDMMEARRIRAQQDAERRAKEKAQQEAILARQRAEARALIEKGRAAAIEIRQREAQEAADDLMREQRRFRHTYPLIERRMCRVFKIALSELRSDNRSPKICVARQATMYWARRLTPHSLNEVGRFMGGKDHSTVLHGSRAYPKKRAKMGRHLREVR